MYTATVKYTRNEWRRLGLQVVEHGEIYNDYNDIKRLINQGETTLQTSREDNKLHSKRVERIKVLFFEDLKWIFRVKVHRRISPPKLRTTYPVVHLLHSERV